MGVNLSVQCTRIEERRGDGPRVLLGFAVGPRRNVLSERLGSKVTQRGEGVDELWIPEMREGVCLGI